MSGDLESVLRIVALLAVFLTATWVGVLNARRHDERPGAHWIHHPD